MADEANHRDVNHTFAEMKNDDPNPFIAEHRENAAMAWRLKEKHTDAWTIDTPVTAEDTAKLAKR